MRLIFVKNLKKMAKKKSCIFSYYFFGIIRGSQIFATWKDPWLGIRYTCSKETSIIKIIVCVQCIWMVKPMASAITWTSLYSFSFRVLFPVFIYIKERHHFYAKELGWKVKDKASEVVVYRL